MKTVLVTGATSGFGKSIVQEFLSQGFQVVASGRKLSQRKEIFLNERAKYQKNLVELDLDVTNSSEVEKVSEYFASRKLDVLVNNAGYAVFGPAEECNEAAVRRQFDVNFFGLVLVTQKLLPALRKTRGQIINISSVFGFMGFPLSSMYSASKYAVEGFSESLSYELKPFGVRVTLVQPGGYRTNFNQSAEWGMSVTSKDSIYYKQVQNYTLLRNKMATKKNFQKPEEVAKGVVSIAQEGSPRLSYTFGKDAMMTKLMKRVFSRSFFHKLTGLFIDKIFLKELK